MFNIFMVKYCWINTPDLNIVRWIYCVFIILNRMIAYIGLIVWVDLNNLYNYI